LKKHGEIIHRTLFQKTQRRLIQILNPKVPFRKSVPYSL